MEENALFSENRQTMNRILLEDDKWVFMQFQSSQKLPHIRLSTKRCRYKFLIDIAGFVKRSEHRETRAHPRKAYRVSIHWLLDSCLTRKRLLSTIKIRSKNLKMPSPCSATIHSWSSKSFVLHSFIVNSREKIWKEWGYNRDMFDVKRQMRVNVFWFTMRHV